MFSFFKSIFIFILIEVIVLASFMAMAQGSYDKTMKVVKINNEGISLFSTESYRDFIFPIYAMSEVDTYGIFGKGYGRNELSSSSKIILTVDEYEVYYRGIRINYNLPIGTIDKSLDFKKVDYSKMQLKIQRKNKVIYDGEFKKNITEYVSEKGRYFIHIYVNRKNDFHSTIKTHISFNIIVDGGNNE
jgi:hypothetical protein